MVKAIMKVHELYREKIIFPAMVSFGYLSWAVFIIFYSFNEHSLVLGSSILIPLPNLFLFGRIHESFSIPIVLFLLAFNTVLIFLLLGLVKKDNYLCLVLLYG
jgi:hypothetical protein